MAVQTPFVIELAHEKNIQMIQTMPLSLETKEATCTHTGYQNQYKFRSGGGAGLFY